MKNESILTIGSIALDTIYTKNEHRENILGGSASYFSIAASYFRNVNVLGVVGKDFPKKYWDLYENFSINIDNIEIKNGSTFRWGGKYSDDYNSRETLFTELGVFENYSPKIRVVDAISDLPIIENGENYDGEYKCKSKSIFNNSFCVFNSCLV